MAFTYVTGSATGVFQNLGPALVQALNQTPGSGNLLLIETLWNNGGTGSVADPNNGTWTPVGTVLDGTGSLAGFHGRFFYVPSSVALATTVTLTVTGGTAPNFMAFEVTEYSYTGGTLALDGTANNNATAVASVATTSTISTTGSSDLVAAAVYAVDSGAGALSPYTLRDGNSYNANTGALIEDRSGVTSGNQSATVSTGGATDNTMLGIIAFKTGSSNAPDDNPGFMPGIQSPNPVVSVWS